MKRALKVLLIIVVLGLIIIQFIKPEQNAGEEIVANQIEAINPVPGDVHQTLKISCYDCHSNTTQYPWYSKIQPVAWVLSDHIVEGKDELNFSEFATYPAYKRYKKFKEIIKEVKDGEMPMTSYTLLHRNAVLNAEQKSAIENWAQSAVQEMESKFPADSLAKPK